jgi:CrcB protein
VTALFVFAGAIIGAPLRYLADRFVQARHRGLFPWGTFTVNLVGCLVLGGLSGAGSALPATASLLVGTGFCGALTTYSTFAYETVRLLEKRAYLSALGNAALSVVAGVGAAALGYVVVKALVA